MRNRDSLLERIQRIQRELEELRLEILEGSFGEEEDLQVGDRVRIRNPKVGQVRKGLIVAINPDSNFVTVRGEGIFRGREIRRLKKNVERI